LRLVQEGIAVGILLVVLAHNLQGKKTNKVHQYDYYNRCTQHVLTLFQIEISFHSFFPPIDSAHITQMSVDTVLANILSSKVPMWKKENVSISQMTVQNKPHVNST
jgi:hypothetical protein